MYLGCREKYPFLNDMFRAVRAHSLMVVDSSVIYAVCLVFLAVDSICCPKVHNNNER